MSANTYLLRIAHRSQSLYFLSWNQLSSHTLRSVSRRELSTTDSSRGGDGDGTLSAGSGSSSNIDSSHKSHTVSEKDKVTVIKPSSSTTPLRGAYGQPLVKRVPSTVVPPDDGMGTTASRPSPSPPTPTSIGSSSSRGRFTGGTVKSPASRDSKGIAGPLKKPPPTPPQSSEHKQEEGRKTTDSVSVVSSTRPHKSHWDRKPNFSRTILEPAAQGHLQKGYESGIPKLTARKHKSSTEKDAYPQRQDRNEALSFSQQLSSPEGVIQSEMTVPSSKDIPPREERSTSRPRIIPRVEDIISGRTSIKSVVEQYSKQRAGVEVSLTSIVSSSVSSRDVEDKTKEEISSQQPIPLGKIMSREHLISLFRAPTTDSLNSYLSNQILPCGPKRSANFITLQRKVAESYIKTGMDSWGDPVTPNRKEELIQEQRQIQNQFTNMSTKISDATSTKGDYGIWPTEYKEYTLHIPHTDSRRQPRPIAYPTNRIPPPLDFVRGKHGPSKVPFKSFLFVQRIPHPVMEEMVEKVVDTPDDKKRTKKIVGRFDQPTHRHLVSEYVASILGVDISQVCPASMTSAFVGFDSPEQAANVILAFRSRKPSNNDHWFHEQHLTNLNAHLLDRKTMGDVNLDEESTTFLSRSTTPEKDNIIQVSNIPPGMKAGTLLRFLHGIDPSILSVDKLTKDHIQIVDPTTAWIRVSSPVSASSFSTIGNHLRDNMIPNQALLLLPVQRSIVHSGYAGPARHYQIQRFGNDLIVHGDTPSLDFFRSHAMVFQLTNVCGKITPMDIARYFQQYCVEERDVLGSTEYIYDLEGHFTGRVYVGFDLQEEGIAAWKAIEELGQRIQIVAGEEGIVADGSFIRVRPVQEKDVKRSPKLAPRTYRSEEELLDSLMDWTKHVDQSDIEYLESMGIGKHVLAEAFMAVRHNNPTFGTEDWARQGEKLRNEKKPGHHFRQFVRLYVETLKEVATTREKPGMLYEAMFVPGEEMDLEIFDREEARLEKLKQQYEY